VVAQLVFLFPELAGGRRYPIDLLQEIADILGTALGNARTHARERRLAMILDTSGDAMLAWDRDGRITDVNGAAVALTGRPASELIGTRIAELLDPLPEAVADWPDNRMDLRWRGPDGEEGRVAVAATLTEVADDASVAAHALLRDLSHVVQAEREAA